MSAPQTAPRADADMVCIGCQKHPSELSEYNPLVTGATLTAAQYVRREEGTYNPSNGHFLCTSCYIDQGMPIHPIGWTCP